MVELRLMQAGISYESLNQMTETEVMSYLGVLEAIEEKMAEERDKHAR